MPIRRPLPKAAMGIVAHAVDMSTENARDKRADVTSSVGGVLQRLASGGGVRRDGTVMQHRPAHDMGLRGRLKRSRSEVVRSIQVGLLVSSFP